MSCFCQMWKCIIFRALTTQATFNITSKIIMVLGECCHSGSASSSSSLNLLALLVCLWCCIFPPGRCRLRCSRSWCCLHILVGRIPSSSFVLNFLFQTMVLIFISYILFIVCGSCGKKCACYYTIQRRDIWRVMLTNHDSSEPTKTSKTSLYIQHRTTYTTKRSD